MMQLSQWPYLSRRCQPISPVLDLMKMTNSTNANQSQKQEMASLLLLAGLVR
jgi:hypothetical protein